MKPIIQIKIHNSLYEVYTQKPDFNFLEVMQVHGDQIIDSSVASTSLVKADGMISTGHETLAIKTADCLPVAIIGQAGHALVHAGWRGLKQEILKNKELLKIEPTHFYIGPHIRNYEVGAEFSELFPNFTETKNEKLYLELENVARKQIKDIYPQSIIESTEHCTFTDSSFHSYRRDRTTERNWNIIRKAI